MLYPFLSSLHWHVPVFFSFSVERRGDCDGEEATFRVGGRVDSSKDLYGDEKHWYGVQWHGSRLSRVSSQEPEGCPAVLSAVQGGDPSWTARAGDSGGYAGVHATWGCQAHGRVS